MNLIEKLRKLEAGASLPPWNTGSRWISTDGKSATRVAKWVEAHEGRTIIGDEDEDLELIAESRNALPTLLEALELAMSALRTIDHDQNHFCAELDRVVKKRDDTLQKLEKMLSTEKQGEKE